MSSHLPLPLNPSLPHKFHSLPQPFSPFSALLKPSSLSLHHKSLVCHCSNPSHSDREEAWWLREEQRWLREEQRWLREEQRWVRERESLLRQISDLNIQIQALERRILAQEGSASLSSSSSVADAIANVSALLQVLKDKNSNLITESGSSSRQMVLEEKSEKEEAVIEKEVVIVEAALDAKEAKMVERRSALRKGSEGEEVREMQEALLKLGFYSGEEDMEYSSFSSGTECAVNTWQAALGVLEDGIMTAELLERLYMEIKIKDTGNLVEKENSTVLPEEGANGVAGISVTKISEVQQTVVEKGDEEIEVSHRRVFLLGENRWEEPSRLVASKRVDRSMNNVAAIKCLQCRGEGRLLCTECDGTGEPNIEPQFLEWVDEGAKCPYCEGLGYTICDTCKGNAVV